jgi:hypothetical protein
MPSLPMLPETAPFQAEQITALNRIMSGTSAEQRTWLSGFLAGYQAANAPQPAAAAPPARRAPLSPAMPRRSPTLHAGRQASWDLPRGCSTWRTRRRRWWPLRRMCW